MIHLMNSAVMPAGNYGRYEYAPATIEDLRAVMQGRHGRWASAIGYPQNAALIDRWTGVACPVCRVATKFADGDRALVMRLTRRVDPTKKGAPVSSAPEDWEFAWVSFSEEG